MGLKYVDAKAQYSDPASSGLKGLRADGTWATPDVDHKWLDAAGEWSVPELWTPPANIADASWEDIEKLSALAAENPQNYSKYLGQTIMLDMSSLGGGCTNVTAMIIGIGHDVDPQGKKLGFTFQLRDGMRYFQMNSSASVSGGWKSSLMRSTHMPEIKAAMPEELRSRLKKMVKKTNRNYKFNALDETQDELAVLSQFEVWGYANPGNWTVPSGEGNQYQWYAQHNGKDWLIKSYSGTYDSWWTRTVHGTNAFRTVYAATTLMNPTSSMNYSDANLSLLACPCFCI